MSKSKLDARLESTGPKKITELKFTDYSINKYKPIFNGKKELNIPFTDSGIKGLKLKCVKSRGNKFFIQNFWFNKRSDYWTVGEFSPDNFGIKDCKTKVVKIMDNHTDDNGLWIKSPKITARHLKERVSKAELEKRKMLTVKECIERLYKAGVPKVKREGTLAGRSIMDITLHLMGKNKRTRHLEHDDDKFGNGFLIFKSCKAYNTKKPESWNDLFLKFPSGHGNLKKVNGKVLTGVSMYDHPVFSKYLIEELTPGLINSYIDEFPVSWGTKRKIIYALQVLWANSKKYMGTTKPLDPTTKEALEVKLPGVSKSKNSKYNRRKCGPDEMQKMWLAYQQIHYAEKHTFQPELLMLEMVSGKHFMELSKLKKTDVFPKGKKDNDFGIDNIIVLPSGSIKGREEGYVVITEPVQFVLDQIDNVYKRPGVAKYKFIPWLFPTIKSTPKSWLVEGSIDTISQEYIHSKKTRLRDIRECWKTMEAMTGLKNIVQRMYRKTYASMSVKKLGTSAKARKLTGHKKASTLDIHYDIHDTEQIKGYANEVADSFVWTLKDST